MKTKTFLAGITAAALVFSMETMSVFAAPADSQNTAAISNGACAYCCGDCQFIDEDGDGVCDNYSSRGANGGNAGQGYIDADGDGVCDNYASGRQGGCGNQGRHHGNGRHRRR